MAPPSRVRYGEQPFEADAIRRASAAPRRSHWREWSVSTLAAGFLAVLVSYPAPLAVFYQAAQAEQVPDSMFTSPCSPDSPRTKRSALT